MNHIRNPSRGQLAGARQLGQRHRIPAIGLDPIARALRDQRWRHYDAGMAERDDLPIKPVAGGPGLVTEVQLVVLAGKLRNQLSDRLRRVGDLTQIPHLAGASGFCYRHSVLELRAIERNENFPISVQGETPRLGRQRTGADPEAAGERGVPMAAGHRRRDAAVGGAAGGVVGRTGLVAGACPSPRSAEDGTISCAQLSRGPQRLSQCSGIVPEIAADDDSRRPSR